MFFILEIDPILAGKVKDLQTLHSEGSKYVNKLNIDRFKFYLRNKSNGLIDFQFIEEGLPLWLTTHGKLDSNGDLLEPTNLSTKVNNLLFSLEDVYAFVDKLSEECENGQIEPIDYNPKYICMIFGVAKKDAYGFYTKIRVIRNGSYKSKNTTAINEWIKKEKCKMPTIPNLIKYCQLFQTKKWFAIRDLADFFRQIGLIEADCDFIGYSLFGLRFRDRKQPYGVSSAPANCVSFICVFCFLYKLYILLYI